MLRGGVESNYSKAEKQECDNRFPPQNLLFQRHVYFSLRKFSYFATVYISMMKSEPMCDFHDFGLI